MSLWLLVTLLSGLHSGFGSPVRPGVEATGRRRRAVQRSTNLTCGEPHGGEAFAEHGPECAFHSSAFSPSSQSWNSFVGVLSDFTMPAVTFAYYNNTQIWEPYPADSQKVQWGNISSLLSVVFHRIIEFKDDNGNGLYNPSDTIRTQRLLNYRHKSVNRTNKAEAIWQESSVFNVQMFGNDNKHEAFRGIWATPENIYNMVNIEYPTYGAQDQDSLLALELNLIFTHGGIPVMPIPVIPIVPLVALDKLAEEPHGNATLLLPQAEGLPDLYMQWATVVQTPFGDQPCQISNIQSLDPSFTDPSIVHGAQSAQGQAAAGQLYVVFPPQAYQSGQIHWSFTLGMGALPVGASKPFQLFGLGLALIMVLIFSGVAFFTIVARRMCPRFHKVAPAHWQGPLSESDSFAESLPSSRVSGLLDPWRAEHQ